MIFLNLYIGFFLFNANNRTKTLNSKTKNILYFYALTTVLSFFCSVVISYKLSPCIPLLIGFFYFTKASITKFESDSDKLNSIIIMCEMTLIYLKTGRSFDESVRLGAAKLDRDILDFKKNKKNVVVQQPKSRKLRLFVYFTRDLESVSKVKVGKLELLESIKTKYDTFLALKQKTKTATTQYRAQSFTLLALWLLSLSSLLWQNKLILYKNTVLLSLVMMISGLILSRAILIKTEFRI